MQNVSNTNSMAAKVQELKQRHSNKPFGQLVSVEAHKKNEVKKTETSTESVKNQLNKSILQANLEVSVSAGDNPMALLYKAAIEGINDVLQAEFGDNAIQNSYDAGLDVSPEATADRIVTMSTAFFSKYREQHPEMTDEEAAKAFVKVIGQGIDQGFTEARDVLDGLQVLEGDIAKNIDSTYELVQDGLQAFVENFAQEEQKQEEPVES